MYCGIDPFLNLDLPYITSFDIKGTPGTQNFNKRHNLNFHDTGEIRLNKRPRNMTYLSQNRVPSISTIFIYLNECTIQLTLWRAHFHKLSKMQLDVGSVPTLRFVHVTCINLNLERFTHWYHLHNIALINLDRHTDRQKAIHKSPLCIKAVREKILADKCTSIISVYYVTQLI